MAANEGKREERPGGSALVRSPFRSRCLKPTPAHEEAARLDPTGCGSDERLELGDEALPSFLLDVDDVGVFREEFELGRGERGAVHNENIGERGGGGDDGNLHCERKRDGDDG